MKWARRSMPSAQQIKEFLRYAIVGAINAAVYLALYSVLVLLGVQYVVAAVVGFPLPVALGYWLHERWTFARNEPTLRRLGTFLVFQILAFGGGVLLLIVLVSGFGLNPILARVISTPIPPLLVYGASRAYIFAEHHDVAVSTTHDGATGR